MQILWAKPRPSDLDSTVLELHSIIWLEEPGQASGSWMIMPWFPHVRGTFKAVVKARLAPLVGTRSRVDWEDPWLYISRML